LFFSTAKPSGLAAGKPPQNFNNSRDAACFEGNWLSEKGSRNTFQYFIEKYSYFEEGSESAEAARNGLEISAWEGSGTVVAPGYGNHEYTIRNVDLSFLRRGETVKLTVFSGDGESAISIDMFPRDGVHIFEEGPQIDSIYRIYDQGANSEKSIMCKIWEPGIYSLCFEGSWISEKGATNTFRYLIERVSTDQ